MAISRTNQYVRKAVRRELPLRELAAAFAFVVCNAVCASWLIGPAYIAHSFALLLPARPVTVRGAWVCVCVCVYCTHCCCAAPLSSAPSLLSASLAPPPCKHIAFHPCSTPAPPQVWEALFAVLVNDSLLRFAGLLPKLLLVTAHQALPSSGACSAGRGYCSCSSCCGGARQPSAGISRDAASKSARSQARMLTLLEYVIMLYRIALPAPLW